MQTMKIDLLPHNPDRNGRIWPKDVLKKAFDEALNRECGLFICYDPAGYDNMIGDMTKFTSIDPKTVVGKVLDYDSENDSVTVEIKADPPATFEFSLRNLHDDLGLKPGIRGTSQIEMNENGQVAIKDDLKIFALDMIK